MARSSIWKDDYWVLLMQLYLKKPVGVKALYNRDMVDLSMELHIAPEALQSRMQQIAQFDTAKGAAAQQGGSDTPPRIERIYRTYSDNSKKLARAVRMLRQMSGFGAADVFYDGVEVEETFEKDFRPLREDERLMPVMLIIVLDLYFRLTPATMVAETPEVQEAAQQMKLPTDLVVDVLHVYQHCDPYLKRDDNYFSPLLLPCQQVWQRFGNIDTVILEKHADELREYFRR